MSKQIFYRLPRLLSVCFTLLLAILALDAFGAAKGWAVIPAFLMHLIPAFILLVITIIARKRDLFGAIAFTVIAFLYLALVGFGRHWSWYVTVFIPALVIAALYFVNWRKIRKQNKTGDV